MLCLKKWALNWIMILPRICIRQYAPIRVALSTVTLRLKQCVRRQNFWNMILTMRKWQDYFLTVSRFAAAKLKAEITENIKEYADGKIKAVITDEKIGAKYGMGKEDIPNLVDIPRRIEGTEIAVCIKRTNNGFRLNLRSNGKADVAEVAMKFGGGGHIKAAGATLDFDSTDKAERAVIDACKKSFG